MSEKTEQNGPHSYEGISIGRQVRTWFSSPVPLLLLFSCFCFSCIAPTKCKRSQTERPVFLLHLTGLSQVSQTPTTLNMDSSFHSTLHPQLKTFQVLGKSLLPCFSKSLKEFLTWISQDSTWEFMNWLPEGGYVGLGWQFSVSTLLSCMGAITPHLCSITLQGTLCFSHKVGNALRLALLRTWVRKPRTSRAHAHSGLQSLLCMMPLASVPHAVAMDS